MPKGKTSSVFFCQNCGYESSKWMGQCPGCKAWNSFVEEVVEKKSLAYSSVLCNVPHACLSISEKGEISEAAIDDGFPLLLLEN